MTKVKGLESYFEIRHVEIIVSNWSINSTNN